MAKCKNCKHLKIDSSIEKKICFLIGEIGNPDEEISCCCYRQATNADRIRCMTYEELAWFLCKVKADYQWIDQEFPREDEGGEWEEWLKSEVGCE